MRRCKFTNTHIEHSALWFDTRLCTAHKEGVRVIVGTNVDTNVVTTQAIILRERGGREEREREREREREKGEGEIEDKLN